MTVDYEALDNGLSILRERAEVFTNIAIIVGILTLLLSLIRENNDRLKGVKIPFLLTGLSIAAILYGGVQSKLGQMANVDAFASGSMDLTELAFGSVSMLVVIGPLIGVIGVLCHRPSRRIILSPLSIILITVWAVFSACTFFSGIGLLTGVLGLVFLCFVVPYIWIFVLWIILLLKFIFSSADSTNSGAGVSVPDSVPVDNEGNSTPDDKHGVSPDCGDRSNAPSKKAEADEEKTVVCLRLEGNSGYRDILPEECPFVVTQKVYAELSTEWQKTDFFQFELKAGKNGAMWMICPLAGCKNSVRVGDKALDSGMFLSPSQSIVLIPPHGEDGVGNRPFAELKISFRLGIQQKQLD